MKNITYKEKVYHCNDISYHWYNPLDERYEKHGWDYVFREIFSYDEVDGQKSLTNDIEEWGERLNKEDTRKVHYNCTGKYGVSKNE